MPIINRKRRAVSASLTLPKHIITANTNLEQQAEPEQSPPPTRRRHSPSPSGASSIDDGVDGEADGDTQGGGSHDQMVKKLVRLALASEYSRQPIRRTDITAKGSFFHFRIIYQ